MAEFCSACSKKIFGRDYEDLKGLITEDEVMKGYAAKALCEVCGNCLVDHLGVCQGGCFYHGKPGHSPNPKYPLYPQGHEPKTEEEDDELY